MSKLQIEKFYKIGQGLTLTKGIHLRKNNSKINFIKLFSPSFDASKKLERFKMLGLKMTRNKRTCLFSPEMSDEGKKFIFNYDLDRFKIFAPTKHSLPKSRFSSLKRSRFFAHFNETTWSLNPRLPACNFNNFCKYFLFLFSL